MGQSSNPPVYVLVSEKAGVPLRAIEKYVKYVSRTVTTVHAGTRSAHSLITSEKLESEPESEIRTTGGPLRWHVYSTYGQPALQRKEERTFAPRAG